MNGNTIINPNKPNMVVFFKALLILLALGIIISAYGESTMSFVNDLDLIISSCS